MATQTPMLRSQSTTLLAHLPPASVLTLRYLLPLLRLPLPTLASAPTPQVLPATGLSLVLQQPQELQRRPPLWALPLPPCLPTPQLPTTTPMACLRTPCRSPTPRLVVSVPTVLSLATW